MLLYVLLCVCVYCSVFVCIALSLSLSVALIVCCSSWFATDLLWLEVTNIINIAYNLN